MSKLILLDYSGSGDRRQFKYPLQAAMRLTAKDCRRVAGRRVPKYVPDRGLIGRLRNVQYRGRSRLAWLSKQLLWNVKYRGWSVWLRKQFRPE